MESQRSTRSAPDSAEPAGPVARRPLYLDRRWLVLVPALIVFLIYLPVVYYDLVWDDPIYLRDMPVYRDPDMWLPSLFRPFVLSPNYFRPLALLTFVAELQLAGLNPQLFHLTNLLLHTFNTALVTFLALYLLDRNAQVSNLQPPTSSFQRPTSNVQLVFILGIGLLYGLHPALVEGVAFVSSRFDLLMTTFLLLALLVDVALRSRLWRPILVGLAFLLAALSKEMALAFALALPFWYLARHHDEKRDLPGVWKHVRKNGDLWVCLAVLVAGLVYLGIRYASLGYLVESGVGKTLSPGTLPQHFLLVVKSVTGYFLLTLWPFTSLTPIHYSELPIPLTDPTAWLALVVVGLLVTGLVMLVRHVPRAGWLAVGGTLALLPVANLLPLELGGGAFIAERYLLFPLGFFVLAAALLLRPLYVGEAPSSWGRVPWRQALLLLWLVATVATVQVTLPHWRSEVSLWRWAGDRAPYSSMPSTNLSLEYVKQGGYEKALELAQEAIGLDPQDADAWDNAGLAQFHMGRYAEAQAAFGKAVELEPQNALFWNNLAGALREQGELERAKQVLLNQALRLNPNLPVAYLNLGIVYLYDDWPDLAVLAFQDALRLYPPEEHPDIQDWLARTQEPERWLRLGAKLLIDGESEAAGQAFGQASALGATDADVAAWLSSALITLQDWESAAQVLSQALEAAPQDARLYNNLGVVAREQGDVELARQLFNKAIELAPEWDVPQNNLEGLP